MNQTKAIEVKKYLFRHLSNHLNDKAQKENEIFVNQFKAELKALEKLNDAADKAAKVLEEAKEEVRKQIVKTGVKATLYGGRGSFVSGEVKIGVSNNNCRFATINNTTYFEAPEKYINVAKLAAADIERFCLGLLLGVDMEDVETFKNTLISKL